MHKQKRMSILSTFFFTLFLFFSPVSGSLADVVIDDGDPGTSSTGVWGISGGSNPWDPDAPEAVSLWSRNGATYSWTFTPADTGNHEVSMWWTGWSSRSTSIPVEIEHWQGTDRITINQQQNGGQWNRLGTYAFEAGESYTISITAQPGPTSTCADAVKLEFLPETNASPVAVIDTITPSPALTNEQIIFSGHGEDLDGSIAGYRWASDIDGVIGEAASVTADTPLSEGTHTISFTVYDNDGEPSQTVTQQIIVQDEIRSWIIDNGDPETSFSGTWAYSGGSNPWNPDDSSATSLWARNGSTYTWTFTPSTDGNYSLSMWWTGWSSRSTNIPVSINHAGGTDTVSVNQQINAGMWNALGSYSFSAGTSYHITITAQPQPSSTCADAVKIEFIGGGTNHIPTAMIDVITPPAAVPGDEITFMGTGADDDGTIAAYEWRSDIDGLLSDQEMFTTTGLSSGIHSIRFRVQDDQGGWSPFTTAMVAVRDCNSPVAIMPLGDSITLGFGETTRFDGMGGYRATLHQVLIGDGYNVDFVGNQRAGLLWPDAFDIDHQGTGGITAGEVAENVYDWLAENPAEVVLLHIGTNGFTSSPDDVDDVLNEIDRFEADSGKSVAVILARIINRSTYHEYTTVFNDNLQAMADARAAAGDKLVVIDQETVLDYETDMWDTLHPNNQGYAKMADPWMDELLGLLPECSAFEPFIFTTAVDSATIGVAYAYAVGVSGEPSPTLSLVSGPTGMTLNQSTGEIAWTPTSEQKGSNSVVIQADSAMGTDEQSFTIEVTDQTIIIDNGDADTSFSGTWRVSGGPNPFDPKDRVANSVYSRDGDTYTWTFTPDVSGTYQVSMWWTQYASRSTSIPVTVEHADGSETVYINQRTNGGQWNALGTFDFSAGVSYPVTIVAQPGPSSTCADAVRFVKE